MNSARPSHESEITAAREFFGPRAVRWESRYPDDTPQYEQAIAELNPAPGSTVLDAGCGTGRALPILRQAVGPCGQVIGVDVTDEMLAEAARLGRDSSGTLVLADVNRLPLADSSIDAVFAAGLVSHFEDPVRGLVELARVTRPTGRLALFHPIGRATLARRHGREPDADDVRAAARINETLTRSGWVCLSVDDAESRYLVLAERQG